MPTGVGSEDRSSEGPASPDVGPFRRVILHLFGGGRAEGLLVDYRPPETFVLLAGQARQEVDERSVEQVEFLDVTEKIRMGERDLAGRVAAFADRDPRKREAAARDLRGIGRRALPSLEAIRTDDPAVAQRAALLAQEISAGAGKIRLGQGECHSFGSEGAQQLSFDGRELSHPWVGFGFGHFLDLGTLDPSTVRLEGGKLLADGRPVPTYELFARHLDPRPMRLVQKIRPETGHCYLFRSAAERQEDLVGLLSVESVADGEIELRWAELVSWDAGEIEQRHRRQREDWKARLREVRSGDALLWARGEYGDYVKATFSFEFATRDHVFVTFNDWDLEFGNGPGSLAQVKLAGDDRSGIREVEIYDVDSATVAMLPTEGYEERCDLRVGGTYAVHTVDRESDLWSLFRVTALDPGRWVEFRWRVLEKR